VFDKNNRYRGYLFAEMMAALAVMGVLLVGFAVSLDGFRRFNDYQLVRQRCIAAAQAQLDSITERGKALDDEDFKQLWPKLTASIQESPGTGQWQGLILVEVTVNGRSYNRQVRIKLSRYILENESLAGEEQ